MCLRIHSNWTDQIRIYLYMQPVLVRAFTLIHSAPALGMHWSWAISGGVCFQRIHRVNCWKWLARRVASNVTRPLHGSMLSIQKQSFPIGPRNMSRLVSIHACRPIPAHELPPPRSWNDPFLSPADGNPTKTRWNGICSRRMVARGYQFGRHDSCDAKLL